MARTLRPIAEDRDLSHLEILHIAQRKRNPLIV